jgi:hypothetical protein
MHLDFALLEESEAVCSLLSIPEKAIEATATGVASKGKYENQTKDPIKEFSA